MASSSSRLTKYVNATTIVTADIANSWFGGLYGSTEGNNLSTDDPRVTGHIHDGQHLDGHSSKVDLVSHVTNQLRNSNLADDAVDVRNIQGYASASLAIPEYVMVDGAEHYYLDLSILRDEIGSITGSVFEYDNTNDVVTINDAFGPDHATTDFVFGSPTVEYSGDADHASRIAFIKAKGALRVGDETSTGFNLANVGVNSFAIGSNTLASGMRSFAQGLGSQATAEYSMAFGEHAIAENFGEYVHAAGRFSTSGDAQYSRLIYRGTHTGATTSTITIGDSGDHFLMDNNASYYGTLKTISINLTQNTFTTNSCSFIAEKATLASSATLTLSTYLNVSALTDFMTDTAGAEIYGIPAAGTSDGSIRITLTGGVAAQNYKAVSILELVKISI